MRIVGLITEYNPFHNGHKYHIEEAKRISGADYVIAVMSGNFVQRGTPAVIDKYTRAEMALRNGVDLVLELPVCYATGSAEYFAHGAVALLDQLGIVDVLCFGSECGDIRYLSEAAKFLSETPDSFHKQLQSLLREGLSFPAARSKALQMTLQTSDNTDKEVLAKVLNEPNNILGIEYIKALRQLNSKIEPVTIQRIAAHYHERKLSTEEPYGNTASNFTPCRTEEARLIISSATAIRGAIHRKHQTDYDHFTEIKQSVPADVYDLLAEKYLKTYPIMEEDFAQLVRYKLLSEDVSKLSEYLDISSDLADRLKKLENQNLSITDLVFKIKTKNMTLTRINRALIHMVLNIKSAYVMEYNENGYAMYARVLGIKKESSHLIRKIVASERIPVITKVSKASEQLTPLAMRMLNEDILAAHLYNQAVYHKYNSTLLNEYKRGIVMI